MDLNERLEARRKEIAEQEARQRAEAQQQLDAEREAQRVPQEAERDAWVNKSPAKTDLLNRPTPAKKTVEIDANTDQLKQGLAAFTKKQWVIQCVMAVLFLIGVEREDGTAMWFWGICAVLYFCLTLGKHIETLTKSKTD